MSSQVATLYWQRNNILLFFLLLDADGLAGLEQRVVRVAEELSVELEGLSVRKHLLAHLAREARRVERVIPHLVNMGHLNIKIQKAKEADHLNIKIQKA